MRKAINILIVVLTAISIIAIIKYSNAPLLKTGIQPLDDFWYTTEMDRKNYNLFYDIGIGFLLSASFYLMIEVIPEYNKLHRAKKIISSNINLVLSEMELTISIIMQLCEIPIDINEVTRKDFLTMDGYECKKELSYRTSIYNMKSKKRITGVKEYGSVDKIVKQSIFKIIKGIEEIQEFELLYSSNIKFMECIRQIKSCKLIKMYRDEKNHCFCYYDSSKAIDDYKNLYLRLKKFKYNTEYSISILESEKETDKYRDDRENGKYVNDIKDNLRRRNDVISEKRPVIISGDKYTSKIVGKYLEKRLEIEYSDIRLLSTLNWCNKRFLIIVVDSESIINLENNLEKCIEALEIILVYENSRSIKQRLERYKSKNENISKIIPYKHASKYFWGKKMINKEEPSIESLDFITKSIQNILYDF